MHPTKVVVLDSFSIASKESKVRITVRIDVQINGLGWQANWHA